MASTAAQHRRLARAAAEVHGQRLGPCTGLRLAAGLYNTVEQPGFRRSVAEEAV